MSVYVNGNSISLTRGDSLILNISMTRNGEPFYPASGDSIRFALNKNKSGTETPIIMKPVNTNDMTLRLQPEDTKSLDYGTYYYDIEYTSVEGYVDTFIGPASFKITEEVY